MLAHGVLYAILITSSLLAKVYVQSLATMSVLNVYRHLLLVAHSALHPLISLYKIQPLNEKLRKMFGLKLIDNAGVAAGVAGLGESFEENAHDVRNIYMQDLAMQWANNNVDINKKVTINRKVFK